MDDDAPPGVPEWVVTYGDMMSLLLTFFIMLVSLSEVVAEQKYRAIIEAARQYMGYSGAPQAPPGENFPLNSVIESLQEMKLGSVSNDDQGAGGVKHKGTTGANLQVQRLPEGKSQLAGAPLSFQPGDSELDSAQNSQIDDISDEIAGKPHKLEIRAYSSALVRGLPQTADQRMEISYRRADEVMKRLLEDGIEQQRMRIAIYFEETSATIESQRNLQPDRVEVTVLDEYADSYIGREESYR